jgi:hypothetical protein
MTDTAVPTEHEALIAWVDEIAAMTKPERPSERAEIIENVFMPMGSRLRFN